MTMAVEQTEQKGATTPLEQKVAANLLRARKRAKMSQTDVAKKAGISLSYVSMLERGVRVPAISTLEAVAKAMRVRPADMMR